MPRRLQRKSRNQGHRLEKQCLLNGTRVGRLLLQSLPMLALQLQNACILNRNRDVARDRLQHLQLVRRKCIQFLVIDREHPHQALPALRGIVTDERVPGSHGIK